MHPFMYELLGFTGDLTPDHVIFNGPATIAFWADGTKTVVKCAEGEHYNKRTAVMWCIMKKLYGNSTRVNKILDKLVSE